MIHIFGGFFLDGFKREISIAYKKVGGFMETLS